MKKAEKADLVMPLAFWQKKRRLLGAGLSDDEEEEIRGRSGEVIMYFRLTS